MNARRGKVLLVDGADRALSRALAGHLAGHDVEQAHDVFDAIDRIRAAEQLHDLILCDVVSEDVPGPELWSFLNVDQRDAAERVVFVAAGEIGAETEAFLEQVPNLCLRLPDDDTRLDRFVPGLSPREPGSPAVSLDPLQGAA